MRTTLLAYILLHAIVVNGQFTNVGGERIEIDTLIVPSALPDQKFTYTRDT